MGSLTFSYAEEDTEFRRWTHNLFRTFITKGSMVEVVLKDNPDFLLVTSTALRVNENILNWNIPLILVHNEAWSNYWPPCGAEKFKAILGCCEGPPETIVFPYYAVHFDESIDELLEMRQKFLQKPKTKFCCFVVSNDYCGARNMVLKRIELFDELNVVKRVDSGGKVENNMGGLVPKENFLEWVSDYKFMICLENTKQTPGYLTEKPFTPWFAGTVPIYEGSAEHELWYGAYISAMGPVERTVQKVFELDSNNAAYEIMRRTDLCDDIKDKFSLKSFEDNFQKVLDTFD